MCQKSAIQRGIAMGLAMGLAQGGVPSARETPVETYPGAPRGATLSSKTSGEVQGQKLPLTQERIWHGDSPGQCPIEAALGRFAADRPREEESGTVFQLNIEWRERSTLVRDCLIENVTANWIYRSEVGGLPDAPLEGMTVRNITLKVDGPKRGKPCLLEARADVHLPINGLTIGWQGNEAKWAGVASGAGIVISAERSAIRQEGKTK